MATSNLALPTSQKIVLAAGVAQIIAGTGSAKITVQVPTGTTVLVQTSLATDPEVLADSDPNIWQDWPAGTKAGPYTDVLLGHCSALKLTSAAGGVVYIIRGTL